MKRLIFFVCMVLPFVAFSQQNEREKIQEMELDRNAQRQRAIRQQLDTAIILMEKEEYLAADEKLNYVLKNIKSVPSDLAYYFGENSFHIGKYKQSIDWLNKYIQLKGTTGQHSQEAVQWLKRAEAERLKEKQSQTLQTQEVLSRDYDIDCGPTGKVTCPVCNGSTVIIKKTYLGETYKTCSYCHKQGFLICDDYNKLLRGELKPETP
jgi:tetratricopeptide (TPR) repeat protein